MIQLIIYVLFSVYHPYSSFRSTNTILRRDLTFVNSLLSTPSKIIPKEYYVYIICNNNRTYAGYTVDLKRRLRQHNRELVGGASSTRAYKSTTRSTQASQLKFESTDLTTILNQSTTSNTSQLTSSKSESKWQYLSIMTSSSWKNISDAMKVEYLHKYPTRKKPRPRKYSKPNGRIQSLGEIMKHMIVNQDRNCTTTINNSVEVENSNLDSVAKCRSNNALFQLYVDDSYLNECNQLFSSYSQEFLQVSSLSQFIS